jgi:predicted Rossmann fold flavoprotein
VLQISSYWRPGTPLRLALAPESLATTLRDAKLTSRRQLGNELALHLPERLAQTWLQRQAMPAQRPLPEVRDRELTQLAQALSNWQVQPTGTEGWKKAEVMAGGVDTHELDSRSLASRRVAGLHFIGEVVDVTGWLGGYNFQWAWASAAACARAL